MRFDRNLEVIVRNFGSQPQNDGIRTGTPFGSFYELNPDRDGVMTINKPKPNKTTWYVGIPVMIGTSFLNDKLLIRTGATLSYLISATQYATTYSIYTQTTNEYKEHSTKGYNSFLAGAAIQSTYHVTKYLGVDVSYQYSLTPIYSEGNSISRYTTFTAGLSYNIKLR
jgi:hypothetical protein